MAAPKRPLAKPDQDKPKYIDPFVYGDSGRRIIISPGTNPITQLGQTAGSKFREYEDDDLNIRGMYLPPQTVNEIEYEGGDAPPESRSAQFFAEKHPDKDPLQIDDIMITLNGVENNQTAIHEFMHRGFERLRNAYDRDEIESRFNRSVANILFEPDYEHYLVQSVLEDEGIESTNNYTENVTKSSKEKLAKTVEALNELASDEMGMLGFQTEKDSGPKTRPKRKPKKEKKSFFRRLFNFSEGGDVPSLNPKARPRTKTKEKTLRGRPVWIDNTGEVTGEKGSKYSEVTTTIPWGTEWITAPSIDENGKRLSDDEVKQRLLKTRGKDFITGEELPTFSNPEKASEYAMWRSDTMFDQEAIEQGFPEEFPMEPEPERKDFIDRSTDKGKDFLEYLTTPSKHGVFNQGGAVMNEQMEMAFMQEGGLKDDGMRQDPVSGNEVPSGSMASEVRDDIPAQLSEGEYVVPADVVRFFGVKFFEDLRTEAKMGLQSMEANGRIGGEPVAAPQGNTLSDEEFAMLLQQELQMAEGGMVPEVNQVLGTPAPIQAAEGTLVPTRRFNPFRYAGLGSTLTPGYLPPAPPTEELPAVDTEESCAARGMVLGPNGVCIMPIAEPVTTRGTDDDPAIPVETAEAKPWYEDDSTLFTDPSSYIEAQLGRGEIFDNPLMRAGALMAGPLGLVAGAANKIGDIEGIARSRAALEVARATGSLPAEEIERLQKLIDTDVQGNLLVDQDGKGFGIATGQNYLNDFAKSLGFANWSDATKVENRKELADFQKSRETGFTSKKLQSMTPEERKAMIDKANEQAKKKQDAAAAQPSGGGGGRDDDYSAADMMRDRLDEQTEAEGQTGGFSGSVTGGAVYAGGNRAEGGLMLKKKKPKKKK